MSKATVHIQEPSEELKQKIIRARIAISTQKQRFLLCPYCKHKAIAVFEDTRGHVEAKCSKCGRTTPFDVVNMRRLRLNRRYRIF
jgi:DNA-directed RNA polymerase subunit RPC12/RpoP